MTKISLQYVEGYGYLPTVLKDKQEVFRGEFCHSGIEAYCKCQEWLLAENNSNPSTTQGWIKSVNAL
jgi:hypothetical protein